MLLPIARLNGGSVSWTVNRKSSLRNPIEVQNQGSIPSGFMYIDLFRVVELYGSILQIKIS